MPLSVSSTGSEASQEALHLLPLSHVAFREADRHMVMRRFLGNRRSLSRKETRTRRKEKMTHWGAEEELSHVTWKTHTHTQSVTHTYPHTSNTLTAVFLFWLIALRCTFHLQNIMKNKYVHLLRKTSTANNPASRRRALYISPLISFFFAPPTITLTMTRLIKKRNENPGFTIATYWDMW